MDDAWIWLAIFAFLVVDRIVMTVVFRHLRIKKLEEAAREADDLPDMTIH